MIVFPSGRARHNPGKKKAAAKKGAARRRRRSKFSILSAYNTHHKKTPGRKAKGFAVHGSMLITSAKSKKTGKRRKTWRTELTRENPRIVQARRKSTKKAAAAVKTAAKKTEAAAKKSKGPAKAAATATAAGFKQVSAGLEALSKRVDSVDSRVTSLTHDVSSVHKKVKAVVAVISKLGGGKQYAAAFKKLGGHVSRAKKMSEEEAYIESIRGGGGD